MRWLGKFVVLAWLCVPQFSSAQTSAYDVFDKPISATKGIRLYLPKGVPARGIVLMANAAGSDSRDWAVQSNNSSYLELASAVFLLRSACVFAATSAVAARVPLMCLGLPRFFLSNDSQTQR